MNTSKALHEVVKNLGGHQSLVDYQTKIGIAVLEEVLRALVAEMKPWLAAPNTIKPADKTDLQARYGDACAVVSAIDDRKAVQA